ncbi:alpha-(1,3)-fucosyltransferase C [Lingula anatina]|uniref:Fucosyltransferase n=1 Tax=Lingula anatina TaxID=7574 RepID=A0A1S3IRH2_LINAN|nr:alpha-(1,3)-fucosyltransferase C [Lingula anatina]|eukprot:XP_013400807.1 alpha-(1,3)-fucosyltransferase C [Lingula anatina]
MALTRHERLFGFGLLLFVLAWWNLIFLKLEFGEDEISLLSRLKKDAAPPPTKKVSTLTKAKEINSKTPGKEQPPVHSAPKKQVQKLPPSLHKKAEEPAEPVANYDYSMKLLTIPPPVGLRNEENGAKPAKQHLEKDQSTARRTKTILLWNDYDYLYSKDREPIFKDCPVSECKVVTDRTQASTADAVVFTVSTINFSHMCEGPEPDCDLPLRKPAHQVWVFHTLEAPCQMGLKGNRNKEFLLNNINWTFTHRKDSDIFTPNGEIVKRKVPLNRDYLSITRAKNKKKRPPVGWLVSHCDTPSHREVYVRELQKYIDVEILGKCGKKCPTGCFRYINETHKFYLAFENSLAEDYVTEKFFRSVNMDVVLVTRGGANYANLGIDPHWHINTADYPSPKALAAYLHRLNNDDSLYVPYLEWRNHYMTTRPMDGPYVKWCDFCKKMHETTTKSQVYTKKSLFDWFFPPGQKRFKGCQVPTDLKF